MLVTRDSRDFLLPLRPDPTRPPTLHRFCDHASHVLPLLSSLVNQSASPIVGGSSALNHWSFLTMDERYHAIQGLQQRRSSQFRYNMPQPQLIRAQGSIAPRERYRVAQYDHPTYDAVEDDSYGHSARLDAFGMHLVTKVPDLLLTTFS